MSDFSLLVDDIFMLSHLYTHIGITIYTDGQYKDSLYELQSIEHATQYLLQLEGKYSPNMHADLYYTLKRKLEYVGQYLHLDLNLNRSYSDKENFDYHNYYRHPIVINKDNKILMNILMYTPYSMSRMFSVDLEEKLNINLYKNTKWKHECSVAHFLISEILRKYGSVEFNNTLLALLKNEIDIWNSDSTHNQVIEDNY